MTPTAAPAPATTRTAAYTGVLSLAFSATGPLASAGFDGTVRFWCSP